MDNLLQKTYIWSVLGFPTDSKGFLVLKKSEEKKKN